MKLKYRLFHHLVRAMPQSLRMYVTHAYESERGAVIVYPDNGGQLTIVAHAVVSITVEGYQGNDTVRLRRGDMLNLTLKTQSNQAILRLALE